MRLTSAGATSRHTPSLHNTRTAFNGSDDGGDDEHDDRGDSNIRIVLMTMVAMIAPSFFLT